ncbi:MAG: hypothetical protein KA163_04325 [Bacteroidia bacterium]|nr:hypothetical protein [Bacteroidia bacterium]
MKKVAAICLIILTMCLNAQIPTTNKKTNNSNKPIQKAPLKKPIAGYKYLNLKGKVKSIEDKTLMNGKLHYIHLITFDKDGKILKDINTITSFGVIDETTYTYNEAGFVETETFISKDKEGTKEYIYKEEYDINGNNIATLILGDNSKTNRVFDDKGYVISESNEENGKISSVKTYINNKHGDPTFESDSYGGTNIYTYKYDTKFNWIECNKMAKAKEDNTTGYNFKSFRTIQYY